jgi:hypothetical protein
LLSRDHIAYRPGNRSRGVFAAKDISSGKVIGIQSGRVRFGYLHEDEDELVSDYFLSYGQASNEHCLYDMDSETHANEMRYLNSAQNMSVPPNVRIEGSQKPKKLLVFIYNILFFTVLFCVFW